MAKIISAGSLLVKKALPTSVASHYDPTRILDKGGVKDLVSLLIQEGGEDAHDSLSDLSNLFFGTATKHGYSTPIVDYENDSKEREALLGEFAGKVHTVNSDDSFTAR